jgi:hypothetical protein
VRITDFGLAKRIEDQSDLTLTGQILGTPSYMPPEQALGKRSLIGAASDVYALGAVLYELLAGRPPFRGETPAATLREVETLDPVAPRLLSPATPRDLETICLRCLEKEPSKRFESAQELADEIHRYLRGEPIVSRPITEVERLYRWCRRNPLPATLFAAVVVTGLLGGVLSGTFSYLTKQRMLAEANKQEQDMIRREALLAVERAQAAKLRAQQEPAGWAAQVEAGEFDQVDPNEAVNKALDQFQNRRAGTRRASREQYDVKALTKAMLGVPDQNGGKMLNKLEGDLEFLNSTLGAGK